MPLRRLGCSLRVLNGMSILDGDEAVRRDAT
jgi:hypothetical protein